MEKKATNWIHTQEFKLNEEQGGFFRVSEKGAIDVQLFNQDGSGERMFCVTGQQAKRLIDNNLVNVPGLEEFLTSPEYAAILDNKGKLKEQAKIQRQVEAMRTRELAKLQVQMDRW